MTNNVSDVPQGDAPLAITSTGEDSTNTLKIPETRQQAASRMFTAGAQQTDINIEDLTNQVNDANANLLALGRPSEDLPEIASRIDAGPYAPPLHKQRLEAARQAQTSYDYEQRAKAVQADDWQANIVKADQATMLQAYKTDMTSAVRRTMREHGVDKPTAMGIVAQQIEATSAAAVLPQFARIEQRIRAKYPTAE